MKAISLIFLLMLFGSLPSQAEYRVFVLQLVNSKTNVVRQIQTTLDPEQYETYYPHSPDEKLTYVQTWRCRGRTDFLKPHCTPPQKPLTKAQN